LQVNTTFESQLYALLVNVGDTYPVFINNNSSTKTTLTIRNQGNGRALFAGNSGSANDLDPCCTFINGTTEMYSGAANYSWFAAHMYGRLKLTHYDTKSPFNLATIPTKANFETNASTGDFGLVNDSGTIKVAYCSASSTFKYVSLA
jgi:hypothetical protein